MALKYVIKKNVFGFCLFSTKSTRMFPNSPESTIAKFIENKGAGVHHVAFAVEDGVANALAEAESKEIPIAMFPERKSYIHEFHVAEPALMGIFQCFPNSQYTGILQCVCLSHSS